MKLDIDVHCSGGDSRRDDSRSHFASLESRIRATPQWHAALTASDRLLTTIEPSEDSTKFLRLDVYLDIVLRRIKLLGLHQTKALAILDLGTGTGLFPFVCRQCGHDIVGLDLPRDSIKGSMRKIFPALRTALDVPTIELPICPLTPLNLIGKYDLITGFRVCFNNHKKHDEWGQVEWQFFVNDLFTHLNAGGCLVLMLNSHIERYGEHLRYYDQGTRDYFASIGKVYRAVLIIPSATSGSMLLSNLSENVADWRTQCSIEGKLLRPPLASASSRISLK